MHIVCEEIEGIDNRNPVLRAFGGVQLRQKQDSEEREHLNEK